MVAIDARARSNGGGWEVCTHGGRRPTGIDAVEWAARMAKLGAGEILLTSMDCDGTKGGYALEMLRAVSDAVSIPVIASGGGGSAEDLAAGSGRWPRGGALSGRTGRVNLPFSRNHRSGRQTPAARARNPGSKAVARALLDGGWALR